MQALREAEHTNLKLPEAKRRSRAPFSRNRALESTATGTMLSARRSRFFASGSRTAWPQLRRKERSAHNWHSPPSPQTHQGWYRSCRQTFKPKKTFLGVEKLSAKMLALREAEDTDLKLPEAKRRSRAPFGSSRTLESTATGKMLNARRSQLFDSGSRTARPLLRRDERSST
ncbi:unnamed protein product [Coccothraustes coccothraustes]